MKGQANQGRPRKGVSSRAGSGSVMLEFVIAFPLVLVLMLACFQMAHLWIARMVVHYAAFCAARTALVRPTSEYAGPAQQAAQQVCDWMGKDNKTGKVLLLAQVKKINEDPQWNITAQVSAKFSLITPIVGPILAWDMNPWDRTSPWSTSKSADNTDSLGYPTITLTESNTLPKPYITMAPAN